MFTFNFKWPWPLLALIWLSTQWAMAQNTSFIKSASGAGIPLSGAVIGSPGTWGNDATKEKAFDGNNDTFFDAPTGNGQWVGLDLGGIRNIRCIKFRPRNGAADRMQGGKFQISQDAQFTNPVTLYEIPRETLSFQDYYIASVDLNGVAARYVRYWSPDNSFCNVAEISLLASKQPDTDAQLASIPGQWAWMAGSSGTFEPVKYTAPQDPGARIGGMTWTDTNGQLWLFGGSNYPTSSQSGGRRADLWKWNGTSWAYVRGPQTTGYQGSYGTPGVENVSNFPSARQGGGTWVDKSGNFWLFGGDNETGLLLSDLWKFNVSNRQWTLIKGDKTSNKRGVYGTRGVPNANNRPGGRVDAMTWVANDGKLYLFGGWGFDESNNIDGVLNDLWYWNNGSWVWVSGSKTARNAGSYGEKNKANITNVPPARNRGMTWKDNNGNLILFGGFGNNGVLNDLWKWDGTNWTWIGGSNRVNEENRIATTGTPSPDNMPGRRSSSAVWKDKSSAVWLFGGSYVDRFAYTLGDLWKWDGSQWTYYGKSQDQTAYPMKGQNGTVLPRPRGDAYTWVDNSGKCWLFAGTAFPNEGGYRWMNDIWRFTPASTSTARISSEDVVADLKNQAANERGDMIYPNPVKDHFNIMVQHSAENRAAVVVQDLSGRELLRKTVQLHSGDNQLAIDAQELKGHIGIHIVYVIDELGQKLFSHKIVVQ